MRYVVHRRAMLALLALLATASPTVAQHPVNRAEPAASDAPRNAAGKKILTLESYGEWKRISSTALSPDGLWLSYGYTPNDGDGTLFVKQLDGAKLDSIPGGAQPTFSDDSKWVAYLVTPPTPRGARGQGATPAQNQPAQAGGASSQAERVRG